MTAPPSAVVHLFTDIEGSTRLWETRSAAMRDALAAHDAIVDAALAAHGGTLVKRTGDGVHAVFDSPIAAASAMLALQRGLAEPAATAGLLLAVRCGLHRGADEARDKDFYGPDVNRAARIMAAAHGGQMLLSQVVAEALADRPPAGAALRALGAVRLRDLERPERLYQLLAPPLRTDFPALRSLEATPNNLVQQVSRFIGREDELAALRRLLADNRLVTLFGPGGIGKSRMSAQLGAELIDEFPDGVWLGELAPLPATVPGDDSGRRVALAIAGVLGLREGAGSPIDDLLLDFARDRRLLLLLDNCEHVHAAAAQLTRRLLQHCAGVKVLATSREALYLPGEAVYPLPPLSTPEEAHRVEPQALMRHAAVRLFVDRATALQPDFRLDTDSAAAVAEICRHVDGLPLGLELAAARVRSLPVTAIATRLRDSLALLAVRDATAPQRQRTLRHLIDWSHELLTAPERALFRRLAVFAGSFSLPAAEAVCGGDVALESGAVFDLLALLVERSLVVPVAPSTTSGDDAPRYRLLETMRQFAAERLEEAEGGAAALRLRHLAHYRAVAIEAEPHLAGADQGRWLSRLDAEEENLLAAMTWCAAADAQRLGLDPSLLRTAVADALDIGHRLRVYWLNRGRLTRGLATTRKLLAHPLAAGADLARARGLATAGRLCAFMGRSAESVELLAESRQAALAAGDQAAADSVLYAIGVATLGLGDAAAAGHWFAQAEVAARASGQRNRMAAAINALGQIDRLAGRLDAAEARYAEFLSLARQMGDHEFEATALINLTMVTLGRCLDDTAATDPTAGGDDGVPARLLAAIRMAEINVSRPLALGVLDAATALAAQQHDWARAVLFHGFTTGLMAVAGLKRDAVDEAFLAPWLDRLRAALGQPAFDTGVIDGRRADYPATKQALRDWLEGLRTPPR